jgi:hypothetical protein
MIAYYLRRLLVILVIIKKNKKNTMRSTHDFNRLVKTIEQNTLCKGS